MANIEFKDIVEERNVGDASPVGTEIFAVQTNPDDPDAADRPYQKWTWLYIVEQVKTIIGFGDITGPVEDNSILVDYIADPTHINQDPTHRFTNDTDIAKIGKYPSTATNGKMLQGNGTTYVEIDPPAGGSGNVVGPISATDNALARFDTTTGELIQNSTAILDDSGNLTTADITVSSATVSTPTFFDSAKKLISATGALIGTFWQTLTAKSTPVDADTITVCDSAASFEAKKTTLTQFWTNYLKPKNDATYWIQGGNTLSTDAILGGTSGAFAIDFRTNNLTSFKALSSPTSAVNFLTFKSSITANNAILSADGDTNTGINIVSKGTGDINFLTNAVRRLTVSGTGDIYNTTTPYASIDIENSATSRGTIVLTGSVVTINNANIVVSSSAGVQVGDSISGTGIPANTTVLRVLDSVTICCSALATASGTVTVTVTKQLIAHRFTSSANTTRGFIIENKTKINNSALTIFNGGYGNSTLSAISIIDDGRSSGNNSVVFLTLDSATGTYTAGTVVSSRLLSLGADNNGIFSITTGNSATFQIFNASTSLSRLRTGVSTALLYLDNSLGIGGFTYTAMTDMMFVVGQTTTGSVATTNILNLTGLIVNNTTGTTTIRGLYANNTITNLNAGSVISFIDINPTISANSGTISAFKSNISAGTNQYNLNITGTAINYLNGNTSIKTTTATAFLTLGGGTVANSALRLIAGSMPTGGNILDGNINYDGSNLRLTVSTTDYTLIKGLVGSATLDFPSIAASSYQDLTITVVGAAINDPVTVGEDVAVVGANIFYKAFVSAPNTVTVRAFNLDLVTPYDPTSAAFKIIVHKS